MRAPITVSTAVQVFGQRKICVGFFSSSKYQALAVGGHIEAPATWPNCTGCALGGVYCKFTFSGSSGGSPMCCGGIFHWHFSGVSTTCEVTTVCLSVCA